MNGTEPGRGRVLIRGLRRRCPRCGRGRLFVSWYTLHERCGSCGLKFESGAGDTWAFMYITTAMLTGFIIVGMLVISPPTLSTGRAFVLPLALVVILGSLPYRKGIAIAVEHLINRRLGESDKEELPEPVDGNAGGEGTKGQRDVGTQ